MIIWEVTYQTEDSETGFVTIYCPAREAAVKVRQELVLTIKVDGSKIVDWDPQNCENVYKQVPIKKSAIDIRKIDLGQVRGKALVIKGMSLVDDSAGHSSTWKEIVEQSDARKEQSLADASRVDTRVPDNREGE